MLAKLHAALCAAVLLLLTTNARADDEGVAAGASLIVVGGLGIAAGVALLAGAETGQPPVEETQLAGGLATAVSTGFGVVGIVVLAYSLKPRQKGGSSVVVGPGSVALRCSW